MKRLIILLSVMLCACETVQPLVTTPQVAEIPITVYCDTTPVPVPELPFDKYATPNMTLYDKTQLLGAQNEVYKGWVEQLQGALAGCATPLHSTK